MNTLSNAIADSSNKQRTTKGINMLRRIVLIAFSRITGISIIRKSGSSKGSQNGRIIVAVNGNKGDK